MEYEWETFKEGRFKDIVKQTSLLLWKVGNGIGFRSCSRDYEGKEKDRSKLLSELRQLRRRNFREFMSRGTDDGIEPVSSNERRRTLS